MFSLERLVPQPGVFSPAASKNCDDLVSAARDRLREAMHQRDAASAVVTDKQAGVDRVLALIRQADTAEEALDVAEEQSAAFTRDWAKSGAAPNRPAISTKLKGAVTTAAAEAHAARIASDGALSALPTAEATLTDAKRELEVSQGRVHEGVAKVLAATVEQALINAQQAGEQFRAAADQVQVMARTLAGHWHQFSNDALANELLRRLRDCSPAPLPARATDLLTRDGERFIEGGRQYVALGNALLSDADAK